MPDTEVSFVVALPGWEVLYYFKGGTFESAPVIAWGVVVDDAGLTHVSPVTSDISWSLTDDRPLVTPDGDVTLGELERWPTVWAWLESMKKLEANGTRDLTTAPVKPPSTSGAVLALDNFRDKFSRLSSTDN